MRRHPFEAPVVFAPRIQLKVLVALCHRLATATRAGIEDRRIWRSEASRGSRTHQARIGAVAAQLEAGESLAVALGASGNYLPPLFRQLCAVGEQSGQLDRTYQQLGEHYDHRVAMRRELLGRLAWPLIQLGLAGAVVGLLILVMGALPVNQGPDGPGADLLGFGLIGMSGFIIYVNLWLIAALALWFTLEATRRGMLWTRRLQRAVAAIPVVGHAVRTLALARFAWAAQLLFDTPMDLRRGLPLALQATGNDYYARYDTHVAEQIQQGVDVHQALASTDVFPDDLLVSIAVGEETGMLAETMRREAKEYEARARTAMSVLAQLAGWGVWLLVAALIIMLIFRLASFYIQTLQSVM